MYLAKCKLPIISIPTLDPLYPALIEKNLSLWGQMVNGKSPQERPVIRFTLHVCLARDLKKLYAGADFRSDIKQATFSPIQQYYRHLTA